MSDRYRAKLAMLILLTIAPFASADTENRPNTIDDLSGKTGEFDVTLTEPSPLRAPAELVKRMGATPAQAAVTYDRSERIHVDVPAEPDKTGKYGLLVGNVSPAHSYAPTAWKEVLEKQHIIWISSGSNITNVEQELCRFEILLDAVHDARKVWKIDDQRVYELTVNAAGLMAELPLIFPEEFNGMLCPGAPAWFVDLPDIKSKGMWKLLKMPRPNAPQWELAKSRVRIFLIARAQEDPHLSTVAETVSQEGYRASGFKFAKGIALPASEFGHYVDSPASWLEKCLAFFDGAIGQSEAPVTEPDAATSTDPFVKSPPGDQPLPAATHPVSDSTPQMPPAPSTRPAPKKEDPSVKSARALDMAKNYITAQRYDLARTRLQNIITDYPTTPAAAEAAGILNEIKDK